jgi:hypothetical protein
MTALSSHPLLKAANEQTQAAFTVVCGEKLIKTDTAMLWFFRNDQATAVDGTPNWHDAGTDLNRIVLTRHDLYHFTSRSDRSPTNTLSPNSKKRAILIAGDDVLIELSESAQRLVKVSLDLDSPVLAGTIQYPLLMLGLIDLTVARHLSDEIDTIQRSVTESDVAPHRLTIAQPYYPPDPVARQSNIAPWLIGLALLLLACDGFILALRHSRGGSTTAVASRA